MCVMRRRTTKGKRVRAHGPGNANKPVMSKLLRKMLSRRRSESESLTEKPIVTALTNSDPLSIAPASIVCSHVLISICAIHGFQT